MNPQPEVVTLTGEHIGLCQAVLSQDLMKVSALLAADKDGSGDELTKHGRRELVGFSNRLQLTLLALGLTSSDLENMVSEFSQKSQRSFGTKASTMLGRQLVDVPDRQNRKRISEPLARVLHAWAGN